MTVEIDDRLWNDFSLWAKANGMDDAAMSKYISKALRDRLNLDKYGDLNDKVKRPEASVSDKQAAVVTDMYVEKVTADIQAEPEPVVEKKPVEKKKTQKKVKVLQAN